MRINRIVVIAGFMLVVAAGAVAQNQSFTVTLVPPLHGKVQLTPPLPPTAGTLPARSLP